jgi:hypothetical protein
VPSDPHGRIVQFPKSNFSRWSKFDSLYDVIGDGVKISLSLKHNLLQQFPYFPSQLVGPTTSRHHLFRSPKSSIFGRRRDDARSTARGQTWTPPRSAVGGMDPSPGPHRGAAVPGAAAPNHQVLEMVGDASRGTPPTDPLRLLPASNTHQAKRSPPLLPSPTSTMA